MPTYADVIGIYLATDCPAAHSVAEEWLRRLSVAADASRLATRPSASRRDTMRVMYAHPGTGGVK